MKAQALAVALLVAASAVVALAPAAEARNVCSRLVDGPACPGLACKWQDGREWLCEDDVLREACLP